MQTPWHFRTVASAAIAVALAGAADYILTRYRFGPWMALIGGEDAAAYLEGLPLVVDVLWSVAVWAGLLGALLMSSNRHWAAGVLAVAAIAAVAMSIWLTSFVAIPFNAVFGMFGSLTLLVWCVLAIFFWLYARSMHRAGVLR